MKQYQESNLEAILTAIAVLWLILGLAAPVFIIPFLLIDQVGVVFSLLGVVVACGIWLGIPYLLIRWADNIRAKRCQ